ncbi:carboxypeptidase-like regulatory domain-containing protein [Patescibacteria group bacterium]|nr:carboxypeptidase-like regulatory domain-containing protein [Patescibacteria group bacterium]
MIYPKNTELILTATVIPQENISISTYEWKINNSIVLDNNSVVNINTNDLIFGENTISLRVLNSCGSWSEEVVKQVTITDEDGNIPIPDEVTTMEQQFTVVVNQPTTYVEVIMELKGIAVVTVKDSLGVAIPNATVTIGTVSATTDANGVATLNDISYGIEPKDGTVIWQTV